MWKTAVTKLPKKSLLARGLTRREQLPQSSDVQNLGAYLKEELSNADWDKTSVTWLHFKHIGQLAQARLLSYNKRRSGEIENITMKNYAHKLTMDEMDESLIGDLTRMERYLMESQDLIQTRGKKGTIVPVLIPPECKRVLVFLADDEVRKKVDVRSQNVYLFPQISDLGPIRAYDSLGQECSEITLAKPEQITSTNLRKYMATVAQVMNLAPNELQWVCRHLGHTEKVHLAHYRTMSPYVERVNIGKVLMMQDLNIQSSGLHRYCE